MVRTRKYLEDITALGALNAITPALRVTDYDDICFSLAGADTSVLTVTVFTSRQRDKPDFTAAKSATNVYDATVVQDREDDAAIVGDTGIAFTVDDVRQFTISVDSTDWIAFKVTAWTSGNVTPAISGYNNA